MKIHIKLLCVFAVSIFIYSCNVSDKTKTVALSETIDVFPDDWLGEWIGELKIYSGTKLKQTIEMGLTILPIDGTDRHSFIIRYGEDVEASKRRYELVTIDKEKGLFKVDEKNDIEMEAYYLGGKFFQRFEVMGNLLFGSIEKQGNRLVWEMVSGKMDPVSTTGDTIIMEEEIPPVKAYPIKVFQKGVLKISSSK